MFSEKCELVTELSSIATIQVGSSFGSIIAQTSQRTTMASDILQHNNTYEDISSNVVVHRHRSYKRSNHTKCDDETEVTVDETVGDLNESSSSFSLPCSLHFPSTSCHSRWHGSSELYEVQEHSETFNESSHSCDALNESFACDIDEWNVLRILGEGAF